MAWVFGGKHFGQYTYEHWFDDEFNEIKAQEKNAADDAEKTEQVNGSGENTTPHKPPPQQ